jgi:glycosyltransferase involved in cell wall biosynthesis
MKPVALITPRYAPAIGGVERVVEMQARELLRRGLQVEVITTDPSRQLVPSEEVDGVLVRRFPTIASDSVYFVSPRLGAWIYKHAHEYRVLHAHSYHTPLALQAAVAGRRARVPLLVNTHYHGTGHTRVRRWLHTPYRPFGSWVLRQALWVLCVSAVEEALLLRHFGRRLRTRVVPNAIDPQELASARRSQGSSGAPHVLSVGRLDAYKQPDRLVATLPYLPPESRLTVIGDGPLRAAMKQTAATLSVSDRLQMVGHQSRASLLAHLASADVFASLSRHEAFGLSVLEAAVAGLPVVASDIPAHREIADYTPRGRINLIHPGSSPPQVAEALLTAAGCGRVDSVDGWPLPTWDRHGDVLMACYGSEVRN